MVIEARSSDFIQVSFPKSTLLFFAHRLKTTLAICHC